MRDRDHIERKLADDVARALQVIGMHKMHLSFKLNELAVEMANT